MTTTPATPHPPTARPALGGPDASVRAALATGPRPPRPGPGSVSLAFGHRALLKIKHVPEQLIDVIFIPVLFTLMFTYLFGGALAGSIGDYLQFLLPGTLVMTIVLVSTYTATTLNTDLASGAFDRFRSLPIWRPAPLVGMLIGDAGRYLVASSIVLALGLAMGFRPEGGVVGVLLAVALLLVFSAGLAWVWMALALVARNPATVSTASLLVVFPLTFASNVFVDPATMPAWLQNFVDVNPVSHLVIAVRGLMAGETPGAIGWVLAASAGLVVVFAPLALRLYGRKG